MPDKLYHITFSSPEYTTVAAYLNGQNTPANVYRDKKEHFLNIVGEDNLTNRQRIERYYNPLEQHYIGKPADQLPIKMGTLLYLEYSEVNAVSFVTEGVEVVSNDEPAFKAARLAELERDPGYARVDYYGSEATKEAYPDMTVWIWCRALGEGMQNELQGQFFDLTPFIVSAKTNMSKTGGNWNITLPPLVCELNTATNRWELKKYSVATYGEQYLSQGSMFTADGTRSQFFFNNAIRSNDLIFIRFETLGSESEVRYNDAQLYQVGKEHLANRIYDMIGLVDDITQIVSPQNNDVTINISGRDLSKLFIEDGTYFYALENSQGILNVAGETRIKNSLIGRAFADGGLLFTNMYMFTSIERILKFIIQQLSNIKIVPNDLFTSYAKSKRIVNGVKETYDSRNTRFNEIEQDQKQNKDYKPQQKQEITNGIWQIINLIIDKSVVHRRLCDTSFSTANGSLLNFIQSAVNEPLAEFYMDTYGDQYHLIVRKPPYDQIGITTLLEGRVMTEEGIPDIPPAVINIEANDVISESLMMSDDEVYSWYHFFPQYALINDRVNYSTGLLPAIFFDEYAQVWGSKPFQQAHPYLEYVPKNQGKFDKEPTQQAFYDLKYVIESSQYLPFSRKGSLTLNGDRRIKIGNLIRYKPTGEIFLVNAVQQVFQIHKNGIERYTVVEVVRGLVEQFIYGKEFREAGENGKSVWVSYFNLINTELEFEEKEIQKTVTRIENKKPEIVETATALPLTNPQMVENGNLLNKFNLMPKIKNHFTAFINRITASGHRVIITDTVRTFEEQQIQYRNNSSNARPGTSRHERFGAIDINVIDRSGKVYRKNTSLEEWQSTGVPQIAKSMGLQWGDERHVGAFGNYVDRVHFQIEESIKTEPETKEIQETSTTKSIDTTKAFKNFKVNNYTFNFFMKNLQFNPDYREVRSREIRSTDQEGSLANVVVTVKKK